MRVAVLYYTFAIVKLCSCMGPEITIDIANPDPSVAKIRDTCRDGVTYTTAFPIISFFSKVQYNGQDIWTTSGNNRCTVAFLSLRPTRTLLTLHIWTNGMSSEMKYFERRADNSWRLIDKNIQEADQTPNRQRETEEIKYFQMGPAEEAENSRDNPVESYAANRGASSTTASNSGEPQAQPEEAKAHGLEKPAEFTRPLCPFAQRIHQTE
ncbi:hypothetical protein BEWA_025650 [Theileria equi strain WA]|uniref:Signal peptide containing protein n=1 Tax=Theileria equi strain WA TaxID=1537102 RepID=L0AXG3_THEEQ|nr:hypothetical protein BEWA_025650 [Theileria equi strain WA]AFZ79716.1 hypothetical protein BEWA_025650 [Theileria equi strain WA]|eukprot:XP_004829382.1 hypothetical protein BEWA_025650 [Theileria equi strain WA]